MLPTRHAASPKASVEATAQAVPPRAAPVDPDAPRILKKYPNRRLYDTRLSCYVTLADVKAMVLAGVDFEVRDARSADDLTRSILLQILLDEESGERPMFSATALSRIIRSHGDETQGMLGSYLEAKLQTFAEIQARAAAPSPALDAAATAIAASLLSGSATRHAGLSPA